jgi:hypothetical protein
MNATKKFCSCVFAALMAAILLAGCDEWQYNVTVKGVAFSKVKIEDNGLVIGQLKEDALIDGRPCKQGWVHLTTNGVPIGFTASREIDLGRFKIPADTWVQQNQDGDVTVCCFPQDTEVQGHLCRGGGLLGGAEGVQTSFYPDGALKDFFLRRDTVIQDIPCQASLFVSIKLYENGRLKACLLSEDLLQNGHTYAKGTRLQFDPDGRVVP